MSKWSWGNMQTLSVASTNWTINLPLPQKSHLYGFSPVWRRMWTIKLEEFEKLRPQYKHKQLLLALLSRWISWTRLWDLKNKDEISYILDYNEIELFTAYLFKNIDGFHLLLIFIRSWEKTFELISLKFWLKIVKVLATNIEQLLFIIYTNRRLSLLWNFFLHTSHSKSFSLGMCCLVCLASKSFLKLKSLYYIVRWRIARQKSGIILQKTRLTCKHD